MQIRTVDPKNVSTAEFHSLLLGSVAPRPIALASTIDTEGRVNLSPFSFFNAFGSNPPTLVFSPCRRVRDNTTKHTLDNVFETEEVVINIVNYDMVEQMSLSSTEYEKGVNEFVKSGLTPVASERIRPPRVKESPVAFECSVIQVIGLGSEGGSGNLVICEVLLAHAKEDIFQETGAVDPFKLDAVARLGGDWYCRAQGEALFELEKPLRSKGIGVDQIPAHIRLSEILTGNNLGKLGNVAVLPSADEVAAFAKQPDVAHVLTSGLPAEEAARRLHLLAQRFLDKNAVSEAWKCLLQPL